MKHLVLLGMVGCSSGTPEAGSPGAYGGLCRSDGSCDASLQCVNYVCDDSTG